MTSDNVFGVVLFSIGIFLICTPLFPLIPVLLHQFAWYRKYRAKQESLMWEAGTCNNKPARRHKIHANVQFVLWPAGQQGHTEDYWHNFDSSWWHLFKPNKVRDTHDK